MEKKAEIVIFTDGSSLGNPGPGGYAAIIYFVSKNKIIEIGEREDNTTNNRMELTAAIEALLSVNKESGDVLIYTDSSYLLNGITKWVHGWKRNGWMTATREKVLNQDLWERLHALTAEREKAGRIEWKKVKGHSDVLGNLRADAIATGFAEGKLVTFLKGTLEEYERTLGGSLLNVSSSSLNKSGKAYSYLSLVGGVAMSHKTWAECEKRVKGSSGAKYKKSFSPEDEKRILHEWGVASGAEK